MFSLNPSIAILPGGAIPYVFLILTLLGQFKYSKKFIYSFYFGILFLLFFLHKFQGIFELISYLIGPLFMYSYLKVDFSKLKKPVVFFLIALLVDALIGYLLNFQSDRSFTLLSNEPSHSTRFFFALIFICYLIRNDWKMNLIIVSILFLILNSSFTGFIFFVAFMIYSTQNILSIQKLIYLAFSLIVVILILKINFPNLRITKQLNVILNVQTDEISTSDLAIMTKIGSRRLTQSFLGYSLSKPFKGVGIGESSEFFLSEAANLNSKLKRIDNIYQRQGVTPNSYLAQMCYEIGYLNCLIFLLIIFISTIRYIKSSNKFLLMFGIFQLLFLSTNSFITPWLFLALSMNKSIELNSETSKINIMQSKKCKKIY